MINLNEPLNRDITETLQQSSSQLGLGSSRELLTINQEQPPKLRRNNTTISIFSKLHQNQLLLQNITMRKPQTIVNYNDQSQFQRLIRIVNKIKVATKFVNQLKQFFHVKAYYTFEKTQIQSRISILPFYPDDLLIEKWKNFIDMLTLVSVVLYPIYICYNLKEELFMIAIIMQVIFCCDIAINCLTSYVDQFNNLIIDYKSILKHYCQTWLIPDFFASAPIEIVIDGWIYLKMLRVFKYFMNKRIITYKGQLSKERVREDFNPHMQFQLQTGTKYIFNVLLHALLLIHIFGCLEHYFQQTNYVTSIYWASQTITTLGYGDVQAKYELSIIWMIIGVGFYTFTFGNFANFSLKSKINEQQELFFLTEKTTQGLPDKLKQQCQAFIQSNLTHNPLWHEENNALVSELFYQLKNYLSISSLLQLCIQIPFFIHDINYTQSLLLHTKFMSVIAGQVLYREGECAKEIYFLLRGDIRIMTKDKATLLNILEGTMFGEFEAIEEKLRGTYCVANFPSLCIVIPFKFLKKVMLRSSIIEFEVRQLHMRRKSLITQNIIEEKQRKLKYNRQNVRKFSQSFLQMTRQEYELEKQKHQLQSISEYNSQLLQNILGKKQQLFKQILKKFKLSVYRIIEMNHILDTTPPEQWQNLNTYQQIKLVFPPIYLSKKNQAILKLRLSSQVYSARNKNTQKQHLIVNQIVADNVRNTKNKFPSFQYIINNLAKDPEVINLKRKQNLIQSKWTDKVSKSVIIGHNQIEDCGVKYSDIINTLEIIESVWLNGSMQKFELFQQIHGQDSYVSI